VTTAATGTGCQAHTRAYRDGKLVEAGFDVALVSDHLEVAGTVVWLDLLLPTAADLAILAEELSLHPLSVEDAVSQHQRPKLDHYPDHRFLSSYVALLDPDSLELGVHGIDAFITDRALVTIRKSDVLSVETLLERWDSTTHLAGEGVGFLLYGLLDLLVDGHFDAVRLLDEQLDALETTLFDDRPRSRELQRRSFEVRKSLVSLRRVVLPMREVVNTLLRRDLGVVTAEMQPYYQDVYDHVLRASEWTDSLRDLVSTILETNLTLQGNRLNATMRGLSAWAGILAVTTAITGFYGQNVPYPGSGERSGFVTSAVILILATGGLFLYFKRKRWL
jgi:magnesium transporter